MFDKSLKTLNTVESSVKKFSQKLKIDRTLDDDSLVPNIIDEDELTRPLASSSNTQEILNGTGTKEFLLQKLPQKEAAKYALPNPNSTNTRMHNQPSVRFETNNKIHVIDMKVYDGDGDGNAKHRMNIDGAEIAVEKTEEEDEEEGNDFGRGSSVRSGVR